MVSPSKLPPPTAPSAQSSSSVATSSSAPTSSSRRSKVPKSEEFKSELERQGVTILDDRFELCEYINGGRHGVVYKGIDNLSGHSVAIKIALPKDQQTAFEVKVLSRLGMSKFTPDLLYTGLGQRPHPFIVLSEEAQHLKALQKPFLDLGVGLDLPRTLLVVHEVVQGLQYLHAKGIVHRDLHPKNLLVGKTKGKSQILICDFGLSGIRQPDGSFVCQRDTSLLQRVFSTPYHVCKGSPHTEVDDLYSVVYLTLMLRASKLADVPAKKLQEMKKSLIYDMLETLPEEDEIFADFFATVFAQDRTALPNHSDVLATIKAIDGFNENLDVRLPEPLPSPLTIEGLAARTRQ